MTISREAILSGEPIGFRAAGVFPAGNLSFFEAVIGTERKDEISFRSGKVFESSRQTGAIGS